MSRIRIGIITAPRSGGLDTLSRTIHSMRGACDPMVREALVGVFCDGVQAPPCTEKIDHLELRTVEDLDRLHLKRYIGAPNLARAMRWAAQDTEISVVSEDDLFMARMWLSRSIALLGLAQARGIGRPLLCLSHAYRIIEEQFDITDIETPHERLLAVVERTFPNGMSPVVTTSDVASLVANDIDERWSDIEPDFAIVKSCVNNVANGYYTDPCFAQHMALHSTYCATRPWQRALTARFRPW